MTGSQAADLKSQVAKLESRLRRWGLRLRLAESLTWGLWGAAAGLGAGIGLALAARLWPLLMARALVGAAGLLALAGASVGLVVVWGRPRPLHRLAHTFDRRLGLAERLTTAVEIGAGRLCPAPAMAVAQLTDTLDAAAGVHPGVGLPLRASRRALFALGVLAAALALSLWLPNPQEDVLQQRAAVHAAVEQQIEELQATREAVTRAEGLSEAERETLLRVLGAALAALDEGQATAEGAVAALSEAEQVLAPLQDPGAAGVQAGLARAAEGMADSELTRDIGALLGSGEYRAAAQALAAYAGTEGEALTREQELELARKLAQAAQALAESDPDGSAHIAGDLAEQLAQAAEAIERGDVAGAREAIREAALRVGQAGERVRRQDTVEGTLAQLQQGREQIAQAGGAEAGAGRLPGRGDAGGQVAQQGGQPGGPQPGGGQQTQPGHDEDVGTGAPYEEVYVPFRFGEEGVEVGVEREGLGDEGVLSGDVPLPVPEGGRASVPYREVYAAYADQASAALEGSYIPLGLKRYVRDYFSALEP